ncbi:unnamed protein product [Gongylonema pulchrum]|uniref:Movement protein n=1 Tax=Gongylonema pulchrum TaxID=637853 RepID=A0A183DNF9_9BILA|nr:unnamed protein product [Gongylonema pulchrum]
MSVFPARWNGWRVDTVISECMDERLVRSAEAVSSSSLFIVILTVLLYLTGLLVLLLILFTRLRVLRQLATSPTVQYEQLL